MPISGPASYLTTTDEFLGHWEVADTTLGVGNELKLKDGSARAVLQTKKDGHATGYTVAVEEGICIETP